MSVWHAVLWGALSSAALYLGQTLAGPMRSRPRITGLVSGFGAGTLLAAIAYELVPEANLRAGLDTGLGFIAGAIAYFVGDRLIDHRGGKDRQRITPATQDGSGAAMFWARCLTAYQRRSSQQLDDHEIGYCRDFFRKLSLGCV